MSRIRNFIRHASGWSIVENDSEGIGLCLVVFFWLGVIAVLSTMYHDYTNPNWRVESQQRHAEATAARLDKECRALRLDVITTVELHRLLDVPEAATVDSLRMLHKRAKEWANDPGYLVTLEMAARYATHRDPTTSIEQIYKNCHCLHPAAYSSR